MKLLSILGCSRKCQEWVEECSTCKCMDGEVGACESNVVSNCSSSVGPGKCEQGNCKELTSIIHIVYVELYSS